MPAPSEANRALRPEPFAEPGMAGHAEAKRGDNGPENTARARVQYARTDNHRENRPQREREGAYADRYDSEDRDRPGGANGVDKSPSRHLSGERDEPSGREHKSNLALSPGIR